MVAIRRRVIMVVMIGAVTQNDRQGGASSRPSVDDWQSRLAADRPVYGCPACQQPALQFFAQLAGVPGREDFFRCWACGTIFEI
jgi:hypothetical protein